MVFLIILTVGLIAYFVYNIVNCEFKESWENLGNGFAMGVGLIVLAILWIFIIVGKTSSNYKSVEPIDVYRNKAKLQINGHYIDSTFIVTDSVVVWKDETLRKNDK